MPGRARFVLFGLSLLLAVALAAAPTSPSLADDNVRIDAPANGERVVGAIEVRGQATTADPSRFSFYRLHYGAGSAPSSLRPIGNPSDKPVENGVLGTWDTAPLFQGEYFLQLTVYDTAGGTVTTHVVVNVLPAPTPTPRNQPSVLIPVPGQTPTTTEDESAPPATPLPELPQLDPQIPQINLPPQQQGPLPIQPVDSSGTDPGLQPIQVNPPGLAPLPPPIAPGQTGPAPPPTFDPGPQSAPLAPFNPVNPVAPPPPPVVAPYEPPPTLALPPTPTQFGLPP
jgi:hypothetical protein